MVHCKWISSALFHIQQQLSRDFHKKIHQNREKALKFSMVIVTVSHNVALPNLCVKTSIVYCALFDDWVSMLRVVNINQFYLATDFELYIINWSHSTSRSKLILKQLLQVQGCQSNRAIATNFASFRHSLMDLRYLMIIRTFQSFEYWLRPALLTKAQ